MPEKKLLKFFRGKVPFKESDPQRAAYAAYRRKMAKDPETLLETIPYKDWTKARKEAARPK